MDNNDFAKKLLGTLWGSLLKITDKVGAFIIRHDTGEFYIDDNALRLMGVLRENVSYEVLKNIAECARLENDPASIMRTTLVDCGDDNFTAAFITAGETAAAGGLDELYPVINRGQLADIIARSEGEGFLMLTQFERIDYDRDEKSFIRSALEAIKQEAAQYSDKGLMQVAYHARLQYWVFVPDIKENAEGLAARLQRAVQGCTITDEFGVMISKAHSMTFTGGYVVFDPAKSTAIKELHYASFALYEAASKGVGTLGSFSREAYDLQKNDYRKVQNFFHLLDRNSFKYHFQPIVSARDGSIFAYEALMRTDKGLGLGPLQILDMALKYDRLYDIEQATLFNVMNRLSRSQEYFIKRKLFINAIPSSFLSDEDWGRLLSVYGELMEKVVIELTEQTDTSDEKLSYLMNRLRENKIQMAIDDYGTGYSNTSRLIKYTPDYIKLDHSLIAGIDTNPKLQSIVAGLIEMMHANGFAVLAEGVETAGELRMLSNMKVDLFQGFYISRPKPFFINEISEDIQSEIIRYNLEAQGSSVKIFHADKGGSISIDYLLRERYNAVLVECEELEIIGSAEDSGIIMPITVKEETRCSLTLKNVKITADPDSPAITLGSGSRVRINIVGDNRLSKGGILVPAKSELCLEGGGKLTIVPEAVSCYGIGNEHDLTYGKIRCLMGGQLSITACGDNCIGIGGGRPDDGAFIEIAGGLNDISLSGSVSLGIGSRQELADVRISGCALDIGAASANFVGVGSFTGDVKVKAEHVKLGISAGGNSMCAIGSLDGGRVEAEMAHTELNTHMKGRSIINVGSRGTSTSCLVTRSAISLYSEGSEASGIGDCEGGGNVDISDTEVDITFLSSNGYALGCRDGSLSFSGGLKQIRINE